MELVLNLFFVHVKYIVENGVIENGRRKWEVGKKRFNKSYYQYSASCCIRREDGSEEIKTYQIDTDILFNRLNFTNRLYHNRKYQNKLYLLASQDKEIVKCKIMEEKMILIPRFVYSMEEAERKNIMIVRKILLVIEMLVLLLLNMTRPAADVDFNSFYVDKPALSLQQDMNDKEECSTTIAEK